MTRAQTVYDVVGVGIGPANLSLAALLTSVPEQPLGAFIERSASFRWHAGLMVPSAEMQVHFLKDLVTPVDPTNPYSFLAFLVDTRRFYRLLVTGRSRVPRKEFEQYFRWAASRLPRLQFGTEALGLEWQRDRFVVHTTKGALHARNIVSGVGRRPWLPACARGQDPRVVFHSASLLETGRNFAGQRVAVVGGGQSGAEVVHYLLTESTQRPASVLWCTRRRNLLPLDDSPFVDELFLPNYSQYFYTLPVEQRSTLLEEQRMASDGISVTLLRAIYRRLYDLDLLEGADRACRIMLDADLIAITAAPDGLATTWRSTVTGNTSAETVDVVVCATGYQQELPEILGGLSSRLELRAGRPTVRPDFSLVWDGPSRNQIYAQNAVRQEYGIADPNLSLLAWRSAVIANSLLGHAHFDTSGVSGALDWEEGPPSRKATIVEREPRAERRVNPDRALAKAAGDPVASIFERRGGPARLLERRGPVPTDDN
ncbi:MAG: lysine N(6)-hydroxylase/L-ornithine N(5)-oxygenase family protein [Jatrophihabitantaceae bacterium]